MKRVLLGAVALLAPLFASMTTTPPPPRAPDLHRGTRGKRYSPADIRRLAVERGVGRPPRR